MTDRERLIDILGELDCDHSPAYVADHLLANGVIVLPCKVGDTVYCLDTIGNEINDYEVKNVGITATQGGWGIERSFNAFGKTLFLTREEAEKALAERSVNNAAQ